MPTRSIGPTSYPPSGPAGGDLTGTYPNPQINTALLPPGPQGIPGTQPETVFELLAYAFTRIKFLEDCLGINYQSHDINIPQEITLLEERGYNGI